MKVKIMTANADELRRELLTEKQMDILEVAYLYYMRELFVNRGNVPKKLYDKKYDKLMKKIITQTISGTQEFIMHDYVTNNLIPKIAKKTKGEKKVTKQKTKKNK